MSQQQLIAATERIAVWGVNVIFRCGRSIF